MISLRNYAKHFFSLTQNYPFSPYFLPSDRPSFLPPSLLRCRPSCEGVAANSHLLMRLQAKPPLEVKLRASWTSNRRYFTASANLFSGAILRPHSEWNLWGSHRLRSAIRSYYWLVRKITSSSDFGQIDRAWSLTLAIRPENQNC